MNPHAIKHLLILIFCMVGAVLMGSILASGDYGSLFLLGYVVLGVYILTATGYVPLLAIGLLNPFILPVPFVRSFPFLLLILGICCVKLFLQRALARQSAAPYRHCLTPLVVVFFAWVGLRYCIDPVLPNLTGFGAGVTGFRSYLNYAMCFGLLILLPLFLTRPEEVLRLVRWMAGISLFFILFLTPFIFTKSLFVAEWLIKFGVYVTFFDNGWLRFVVLPGFGLTLLGLALLPNLMPLAARYRILLGLLATMAIILGGNRSTLLMAFALVLTIALLRRRTVLLGALTLGIVVLLIGSYYIGERMNVRGGVGFLRVLSLTSRRVAEQTDALSNLEWRRVRWQRALEEIQNHPILGKGYGGLENAWLFTDLTQFESARVEIDLASGGIHNGFLSGAYSLGIPAVALFIFAMAGQILLNARRAWRWHEADPVLSELHIFLGANLVAFNLSIYIGTDLNNPLLWFFLSAGVLLVRMREPAPLAEPSPVQTVGIPLPARPG